MSKRLNRFLIIDMAEDASKQFSRVGRRLGYTTETASSLDEFTIALAAFSPTVVLIDLQSVDNGGLDYLKALRDKGSDAQIVLTSDGEGRALETAKQLAEFLGLSVVASPRSSIFVNVLRNELRRARQSQTDMTLSDLQDAIKNGDVRPYYQPKATYRAHKAWPISEVEALPRWHVAENNIVMPEDFYWLAEDGGLMPAVTNSLLSSVVEQMAEWHRKKLNLHVSVNLPASSLVDRELPDTLYGMIRRAKVDSSMLTLEVSEAHAMNYSTSAVDVLSRLKSMGFKLAIDEFGTSYSSLEQLYRLKFDELKIDPSLVLESRISSEARTIIEATVVLAQKLGLSVCAEGVDSQRTLQFLGKIGCNKAQGNYISRPLLANMLEARLNEWNVPADA
jgi:EAL domain-containing protein (putative c-di-GMP-specific phosphodiesterase class I)/CheY-like chemotaxis protein